MTINLRSRADLEDMVRTAVRAVRGCSHVIDVELAYTGRKRPNWRLRATIPPLAPTALIEAHMAIESLTETYQMVDD